MLIPVKHPFELHGQWFPYAATQTDAQNRSRLFRHRRLSIVASLSDSVVQTHQTSRNEEMYKPNP